jgi:hypothetical protein
MRRIREGASCGAPQTPPCSSYLYCRSATSTCERAELVGLGEICDPADGFGCAEGACVITERAASGDYIMHCTAVATSGGTCHVGYPDDCPANEYCPLTTIDTLNDDFTDFCTPVFSPGEPCDDSLYGADCGTYPFGCGTSQTCEKPKDVGEPCETDDGCYSLRCSGADPVCDIPTACN